MWRGPRARNGGGSGIGFAVVKELVTAHQRNGLRGFRTGRRDADDHPAAQGRATGVTARSRPWHRAAIYLLGKYPLGYLTTRSRPTYSQPQDTPGGI
ncbi:hypothetical protein OHU89_50110 [Streptomyces sp. NBC_00019]